MHLTLYLEIILIPQDLMLIVFGFTVFPLAITMSAMKWNSLISHLQNINIISQWYPWIQPLYRDVTETFAIRDQLSSSQKVFIMKMHSDMHVATIFTFTLRDQKPNNHLLFIGNPRYLPVPPLLNKKRCVCVYMCVHVQARSQVFKWGVQSQCKWTFWHRACA